MRRSVPTKIGDLWDEYVESQPQLLRKLAEARIPQVWDEIVGPIVAKHTVSLKVERGILFAQFSSSVARSEIMMQREPLCNAINKALGRKTINIIIVR